MNNIMNLNKYRLSLYYLCPEFPCSEDILFEILKKKAKIVDSEKTLKLLDSKYKEFDLDVEKIDAMLKDLVSKGYMIEKSDKYKIIEEV